MTRQLSYSHEAEQDLRDIAAYTLRTRGFAQAGKYVRGLRDAIARLPNTATRHSRRDDLLPGIRRMKRGRHLVFFVFDDTRVLVVRVMHERADHTAAWR